MSERRGFFFMQFPLGYTRAAAGRSGGLEADFRSSIKQPRALTTNRWALAYLRREGLAPIGMVRGWERLGAGETAQLAAGSTAMDPSARS
jgi:hypothetical protein